MVSEITIPRGATRMLPRLTTPRVAWRHLGLGLVLAIAAAINCWGITAAGYANSYYAAAVKSMLQSWHNFFFVSFDPGGFVSVDKPPLGFWMQAASAKLFGFHGWSILLPEALAGVLSVAVLSHLVRRTFGPIAGLVAALALALTPISVVTNRNNTIDSLLILIVLLAAWAVLKGAETGRLRWLLLGMMLVGFGFNIKMLQAYLVLPALVLVYLLGAPHRWRTRIAHLILATVVLLAVSLSWAVAVDLTPASQRPYVGSTQDNSELSLALGYNGLNRLLGNQRMGPQVPGGTPADATGQPPAGFPPPDGAQARGGSPPAGGDGGFAGGGPGGVGENGAAGVFRLLDQQLGGQIGWLLPLALVGLIGAGGWLLVRPARRQLRAPDDDARALEPMTPARLFERIADLLHSPFNRSQQAIVLWGAWLLTMAGFFSVAQMFHRYYLSMMAPAVAALVGIGIAALWRTYARSHPLGWLLPVAFIGTAAVQAKILGDYADYRRWLTPLIVGLAATAAIGLVLARVRPVSLPRRRLAVAATAAGLCALLIAPTVWGVVSLRSSGGLPAAGPQTQGQGFPGGPPNGGAPGGMEGQADNALIAYLEANRGGAKYLVAVPNSMSADAIILATGEPVMAMGGFTGSDPILTNAGVTQLVKDGAVRYFLLGGSGGPGGGQVSATQWVTSNCSAIPSGQWQSSSTAGTVGFRFGSQQLYDCAAAAAQG